MADRNCSASVPRSCSASWSEHFRRPMSPPRCCFTCPLRLAASNRTPRNPTPRTLEREPVPAIGIDLVVRIHAGAPTQTRPHRCEGHATRAQVVHAEAGDEIEAAFDAGKTLEQAALLLKIVDQRENLRTVAADVEADRRPAPVNFLRIEILADEPT